MQDEWILVQMQVTTPPATRLNPILDIGVDQQVVDLDVVGSGTQTGITCNTNGRSADHQPLPPPEGNLNLFVQCVARNTAGLQAARGVVLTITDHQRQYESIGGRP